MDSWTLQGDSYSFLRSAPHTFSLRHRDGTPNHVEIFDIINVPSQRSVISETTCLCDIFGDDCESATLPSCPAVGAFVPPQREVGGSAAASPLVDDLNDSSGSYHTASSEGEEGFEDSRDKLNSPLLQSEVKEENSKDKRQPEGEGLSSGHKEVSEDSSPNLEPKGISPISQLSTACPSSEVGGRTPSPGHNSPYPLSPEETSSSFCSISGEIRCSPYSLNPQPSHSDAEPQKVTPAFKDTHNGPLQQSLTPVPSPEPNNFVSSSSTESVNNQSFPEFREAQVSPDPRSGCLNQHSSPSPEPTSKDCSLDFTESAFESRISLSSPSPVSSSTELISKSRESLVTPEPTSKDLSHNLTESAFESRANLPSPLPLSSSTELLFKSRETPVSLELNNRPSSPDTQSSSPFPELRSRVSLPDLFSRGSTPDIEEPPHTSELISNPSTAGRDTTDTPESQDTRLSAEPVSTVSTPGPRYTPPSPVISVAASPELVESSASPEFAHTTAPSPGLLCAASPSGIRTPSPGSLNQYISTTSEIANQVSSPVVSYSLSPSPKVTSNCSPIEHSHTSPSPVIRITETSPEVSQKDWSSEVEPSASPPPEDHFITASSRSPTSSPHITGVSYSVIQPEDRNTPPLPELSRLFTPEPDRTLVSPEARSPTPSRESIQSNTALTGAQRDSPLITGLTSSALLPDITLSHQPRYQAPSPQPKHHTPSPQPRNKTPSSDNYQSSSPQYRSKDPSPAAPSPEQRYHQPSPSNLSTEYNSQYTHPTPPLSNTPEGDSSAINNTTSQCPTYLTKKREAVPKEAIIMDNFSFTSFKEKQNTAPTFFQIEDTYNNPPIDIKSPSPDFLVLKDRNPNISLVHRATSNSPVQTPENPQPTLTTYSPTSESSSPFKSSEHTRSKHSTSVRRENRERFTEDMAHNVNRRRTPSPPLTRFTPVHILAPEKPYRQWQNRSRSPSQSVASLQSGNLKKVVTNRESPDVEPVDNNSEAHWVRLGTQLEMEREMQLEEDREVGQERKSDRVMERERKREERVPEKGRGWQGDTSYRGEQVDLSFTARNRKGPASRREAPTSREPREGLPTAHSYSESLLATRQLQQQQSLLRLASQQDPRVGGPNRRPQPPTLQSKNRAPGRVPANRPCRSSSSSMGSELDETDNEVKWLTDSSFLSLSSPEVDYLDIYNSSHRSSTNISQPSPQESPAGVNAAWLAYADFRGSAPKLDNDELSFLQPSAYYSDGLDPMRRYEMGSFECVDVAVEREDSRKVRKGVPKRQILLKRKNNADGNQDESSENSSPGVPMMEESPSIERHSGEIFARQQSLPVAMQDCYRREHSPEPLQQNDRKSKLQKSASLDETGHKTKMASCLIKNVLSKRMQSFDKQEEEVNPTFEENLQTTETAVAPLEDSPKPDAHNLSSSFQSADPSTKDKAKPLKNVGVRSSNRPSSSSSSRSINLSQSESEEAYSQSRNATSLRDEKRSELKESFDSKQLRTGIQQAGDRKTWDEREGGDSANATAGKTAPSVTGASSMQARATNKDQECENTEEHKQLQQGDKVPCSLKTKEIPLKAVEKKKASLNVCLTPEAENRLEGFSPNLSFREKEEKKEPTVLQKTEEEEGNGNNQVKGPIHKVRDVRRLVKNTYNLSFKATSAVTSSNVNEERMEHFIKERGEGTKEESKEDTIAREEREVRQDIRREERREKMEEEFRMERKKVQKEEKVKDSKMLTLSSPLQNKGNPSFRSQPMQIQYKAVCCLKEDKNKTLLRKKDSEDTGLSPKVSQNLVTEVSRESSNAKQQNHTTRDKAIAKPYQDDLNMAVETQETAKEMHQVPDNDDKPVVFRTDKKPPILGSLPKLPSKEREVSTAVVLIKDGSSKTKSSESRAQEESPNPLLAPGASASPRPITPGSTPDSSGHSVSTLLKEKGYQADIGAVVGDNQNVGGGKGVLHKHVNCLEIPLQTTTSSDGGWAEPHRERKCSSSSTITGATTVSESTDALTREEERGSTKPTVKDTAKQIHASPLTNMQEKTPPPTKHMEPGDFEAVKRLDPTFPPRSPAVRRFRPQPIEVKSLSTETKKQEIPTNSTGNNRSQTIEVKSIAKNSQKPAVPPKPSCKFVPADLGTMPNEAQRPSVTTSTTKPQGEERPQTIVVSSPTIYRKISNESTSASNYTRKLAVSAVSSLKPPPCKTTATTISNLSNQSTAPSETEMSNDRGLQQKPGASPQSSSYTHKPIILGAAPSSATGPGLTAAPRPDSDPNAKQISTPASAGANQPSQPTVAPSDSHPQYSRTAHPNDQPLPVTSNNTTRSAAISTTQAPGYTHQPFHRSLSNERSHRTDDLRFYASDDPPSYDERESFSPLMLPDLAPRRSNRYQNTSRPPPCSCTAGCPSHPGLTPPHHYRSPHNLTPPAAPHSPGQALPYPGAQPPLRPHQCRPDPQPMSYQRGSPKATPLGPSQPPSIYQPLHQPPTCPPHPSLMQACPADRQLQPPQHIDPRRPPVHRSPQQQLPGMAGAPYSDPVHGHSPGLPPMDPQYMCGPQSLGPSYGSEYGGDTTSLYSESSYGQAPRRVLLDPETGKYFYIEVPVQPLRKMLFDPETGQYVEVLIPQQAMSHSGMYPPSAAPYPSLHNPNMYGPASQYMPYAAPPPQAHPQAQPQPPRYQDGSATAAMHPSGPGVSYRNPSGQGSKPEPQNHPQLDQDYLESMYYVPTGMNASPNPTPPDYYHKHPPNLPPTGGKRS